MLLDSCPLTHIFTEQPLLNSGLEFRAEHTQIGNLYDYLKDDLKLKPAALKQFCAIAF